jgi:DNA-binding response OmpR family regulator
MNILIVEDEIHLAQALKEILIGHQYTVDVANDGELGFECGRRGVYDLILLDIMLPKMNGIDVLKKLRQEKILTPVLMLTAKDEIEDKVSGLDHGADDYMTKPFSTQELLARIRALSRRKGEFVDEVLSLGDISLHVKKSELWCGENSVKLALKEFQIIELLMRNPDIILSKERMIEKIWGGDSDAEYNNVEVYISFLRKKLSFIGAKTKIQTARGMGYSLE